MTLEEARKILEHWVLLTRGWQRLSVRTDDEIVTVSNPERIPMEIFSAVHTLLAATREAK